MEQNPLSRFVDNGDGTITDTHTNLMWQQEDDGQKRILAEAKEYCENLSIGPHKNWRLPTIKELKSISTYWRQGFTNTQDDEPYWSSSVHENPYPKASESQEYAAEVMFSSGETNQYFVDYHYYTRAVRNLIQTEISENTQNHGKRTDQKESATRKILGVLLLTVGCLVFYRTLFIDVLTFDFFFYPGGAAISIVSGIIIMLLGTAVWGWRQKQAISKIVSALVGGSVLVFVSTIIIYDSLLYLFPQPLSSSAILSVDFKELGVGIALAITGSILTILGVSNYLHKKGYKPYVGLILVAFCLLAGVLYSVVDRIHISDAYWYTSRNIYHNQNAAQFFYRTRYFDLAKEEVLIPLQLLRLKSKGDQ